MSANIDSTVPLILAGGRGTRISQLFPSLPKPAVPIRGRPFLVLILEQLAKSGFGKVVISGGYLFDILQKNIQPHIPPNMEVVWVREREPMGTGGGLLYAVRHSGLRSQNWMVMNGDSYLSGKWVEIMKERKTSEAWVVARKVPDSGRYGRLEVCRGRLVAFREKKAGGEGLINAGIYLLPSIWLNEEVKQEAFSMENDLIPLWLSEGRKIRVEEVDTPFLDIGTPEDYRQAESFFTSLGRGDK